MKDLHSAAIPFLMGQDPDGETPMFDGLPDDFVVFAYHDMHLTVGAFRRLAEAMSMAGFNALVVIGALDTTGNALIEHEHAWDEGQKAIYEQAVEIMGGQPAAFKDLGEPPEDAADYWKK